MELKNYYTDIQLILHGFRICAHYYIITFKWMWWSSAQSEIQVVYVYLRNADEATVLTLMECLKRNIEMIELMYWKNDIFILCDRSSSCQLRSPLYPVFVERGNSFETGGLIVVLFGWKTFAACLAVVLLLTAWLMLRRQMKYWFKMSDLKAGAFRYAAAQVLHSFSDAIKWILPLPMWWLICLPSFISSTKYNSLQCLNDTGLSEQGEWYQALCYSNWNTFHRTP